MKITILIGGILLFIFAIDFLSENFINFTPFKLKKRLTNLTNNLGKSLLSGFIFTSLIQSSSALIMILIALINANLLSFNQSLGIILGSNIATTITSFITGLNLEKISPFILLISYIISFSKNEKTRKISKILFSLGLLFFSIHIMSYSLQELSKNSLIYKYISSISNNKYLSLLVSILLTIILQSSSVFIAILQLLSLSGFISPYNAIIMIFGANIGTSFDPLLTILKDNKEAKKVAHFSIFFNIITSIIFIIFMDPFYKSVTLINNIFNGNEAIEIAFINILFNVYGVILILPFINKIKRYYNTK